MTAQAPPARREVCESSKFTVTCLCADWCGTCRSYRETLTTLASRYPAVHFAWLDIEEHAELLGELDIENFPTVLIQRQAAVLFFGVLLPHPSHLARQLDIFLSQTPEQSAAHARAGHHPWQETPGLSALLALDHGSRPALY